MLGLSEKLERGLIRLSSCPVRLSLYSYCTSDPGDELTYVSASQLLPGSSRGGPSRPGMGESLAHPIGHYATEVLFPQLCYNES